MEAIPVDFIKKHIARLVEESRDKTKSADWRFKRVIMTYGMTKLLNYWFEENGKGTK